MPGERDNRLSEQLEGAILSLLFFALCCTLLVLTGYSTALVVGGRGTAVAWADMLVSICVAAVWFFRKASADPGGEGQNKTGNNKNEKGNNEQ